MFISVSPTGILVKYLDTNKKQELGRVSVGVNDHDAVFRNLFKISSRNWKHRLGWKNCYSFGEDVLSPGQPNRKIGYSDDFPFFINCPQFNLKMIQRDSL